MSQMPPFVRIVALSVAVVVGLSAPARAIDQGTVQRVIASGAGKLREDIKIRKVGGGASLLALALLKAGLPAQSPEIQGAIADIRSRIHPENGYLSDSFHFYTAGVEATLLADSDPELYQPELAKIAEYIISHQHADGYWDYLNPRGTQGDTSVTHYAMLGLWACQRAGIDVPADVWERAARWVVRSQNEDGGYSYCPGTTVEGGESTLNMTINAIGSVSIAWINLEPGSLPSLKGPEPMPEKTAAAAPAAPKNNDVLEAIPELVAESASGSTPGRLPDGSAQMIRRAMGWITQHYAAENKFCQPRYKFYYYYSLERMTALVNASKIGSHDWYDECGSFLAGIQQPDGSFMSNDLDVAFVVLALSKSTAKLIKRKDPVAMFGDGLLTGGRGLPDAQSATKTTKKATPLDQLLSSLSSASDLNVQEVQEQIVEQVQIGDRDALVKQKDLLVKIITHPSVEVRRTAAWALGRANDLSLARYLVDALEDPDVSVNVEAHNALCWISRKPLGFDIPMDPLEGLPLDAGPDVKDAAIKAWRTQAVKAWGNWYLKNRPYKDRGDEFEAQLREKLASMTS